MRLLVWLLMGYCAYLLFKGRSRKEPLKEDAGEETFRDPACGVYVTEEDAVIGKVEGKRVYFCSMECLEKYREKLEHTQKTNETGGKQ